MARQKAIEKRRQNKIDRDNEKVRLEKEKHDLELEENVQKVLGKLQLDKLRNIKEKPVVEKPVEKPVEKIIDIDVVLPIEIPKSIQKTNFQKSQEKYANHLTMVNQLMFGKNNR